MVLNEDQKSAIQENVDKLSSIISMEDMHSWLKQYFSCDEIQQCFHAGKSNKTKVEAMCKMMIDKDIDEMYLALCKYIIDKKKSCDELFCLLTCCLLPKSNVAEKTDSNDKGCEVSEVTSEIVNDSRTIQKKLTELHDELKYWHSCVLAFDGDNGAKSNREATVNKTPVPFPCPYRPTRFATANATAVQYCVCPQQQNYLNQANCGSCGNVMHPEAALEGVHLPSPCGEYIIQWRTHQILKSWYTEWWNMVDGSESSLESPPIMLPRQLGASIIKVRIRKVDEDLIIESKYAANTIAKPTTKEIKCFTKLKLYLIGVQTIAYVTQQGTCQLNGEYQTLSTFSKMSWDHFDPCEPPLLCLTFYQ